MTQPPASPQPGQPGGPPPGPYDPVTAPPVMGAPGPPPPPGYGPPPRPVKKSNTGLILGLVLGVVVLLGLAGVGVWFFLFSGPVADTGQRHRFPGSYEPTVEAAPTGTTYTFTKSEAYDICVELELDGVKKVLPLDGNPEAESKPDDDGTGDASCEGQLRSAIEYNGSSPAGAFDTFFWVTKDTAESEEEYEDAMVTYKSYESLGSVKLGEEAQAQVIRENNVVDVVVSFRNGNLAGQMALGVNHSTEHPPPDAEMIVDVLIDVANSGMAALAGSS